MGRGIIRISKEFIELTHERMDTDESLPGLCELDRFCKEVIKLPEDFKPIDWVLGERDCVLLIVESPRLPAGTFTGKISEGPPEIEIILGYDEKKGVYLHRLRYQQDFGVFVQLEPKI